MAVVGLDAASFEHEPPEEDTLALLEGAGVPVLRIKNGISLADALERSPDVRHVRRR